MAVMQQIHISQTGTGIYNGNLVACDPTDTYTDTTNKGFITRWNLQKQRKLIEMVGRLRADICNVLTYLLPGVRMEVKLTKAKCEFYLMNKDADSKVIFKFLDAQLLVKRVKPNPAYLVAHTNSLQAVALAKYNLSSVEVTTFTFASGSQSLSIDNAVLGTLPKMMLFTLTKNKELYRLRGHESFPIPSLRYQSFCTVR
jgi:hypothetical protein